jgi:hypothetical protein
MNRLTGSLAPLACRPSVSAADGFRLYITAIDTGTSAEAARWRDFWHIPAVRATEIYFVTDSAACARAARVHAATAKADTINPWPVFLLHVGPTRNIAFNFTMVGEWFHYAILDSSFALVGTRGS